MNLKLLLFLFLVNLSYAQDELCDSPVPDLIAKTSLPNCINDKSLHAEIRALKKSKKSSKDQTICSDCRNNFLNIFNKGSSPASVKSTKKAYFTALYNELEKNISNSLIDISSLRVGYPSGSNFSSSISKCNTNQFLDKIKKCSPEAFAMIEENNLNGRIANEIANLLSPNSLKVNGILKRDSSNSCNISDQEISHLQIAQIENEDILRIIPKLTAIDFNNEDESESEMRGKLANNNITLDNLASHPIISVLLKNPKLFYKFINQLKKINPKDSKLAIKNILYNPENGYGPAIDNEIAKSCTHAYDSFANKICDPDFKNGNVSLGKFNNAERIFSGKYDPEKDQLAYTPELVNDNLMLFQFCEPQPKDKKLDLDKDLKEIFANQGSQFAGQSLSKYAQNKYETAFEKTRTSVCNFIQKRKSENNKNQINCLKENDSTSACLMAEEYQRMHTNNTPEGRLASSPDKSVNDLLRSFVGDPKKLDPETKKVLQDQGVIPQDNGKFIATPDIPERSPSYFDKVAQDLGKSAPQKSTSTQTQAARVQSPDQGQNAANSNQADAGSYSPSTAASNDSTKSTDDYDKQMSDINNEIARRLAEQNGSTSAKRSPSEVREAVKKVYNDKGKPLDPAQEDSVVNNFMNQGATTAQVAPTQNNSQGPTNTYQAKLTPGKTPDQVRREAQERDALSGMQGAQSATRSPASVSADPEDTFMSKVTVNASEEKVQLRLEDILNDKIKKSDADGQMLKTLVQNKRDFILEINNLSFKIIFDKVTNNFKVTSSTGDSAQSEKIRPQLEKFLKNIY